MSVTCVVVIVVGVTVTSTADADGVEQRRGAVRLCCLCASFAFCALSADGSGVTRGEAARD